MRTRSLTTVDRISNSACNVDGRLPVCGGVRRLLWKKLCISASTGWPFAAAADVGRRGQVLDEADGLAALVKRIGTFVTVASASITSGPVITRA